MPTERQFPVTTVPLVAPQRWKFWFWAAVLAVSGVCLWASGQVAGVIGTSPVGIMFTGMALGVVAPVGASLSVRCPRCGLRLVWYALSRQSHHAWLSWLLGLQTCPRCGLAHTSGGKRHAK